MTVLFAEILKLQNTDYNNTTNFNLDRLLKYVFIDSVVNGGDKFRMLKLLILDNKFLTKSNVDKVLESVCAAQRVLHTLMRLCRKVNYKYARIYDYNMDMSMTPLSEYKPHLKITLLENNTKYSFKLGDMITLIHKRLCNSSSFFPEPLEIVNPYTNIPLSYSSMYKLYFTVKASNYTMPTLFHQFFLSYFDVSEFLDFNECLLKEHIINEANKNATLHQRNKRLSAMMYSYRNYFNYKDYLESRAVVLEKVSHLHVHYLRTKYSLNPNVRFISERAIKLGLKHIRVEKKHMTQDNSYRRIISDIDSSVEQNPFLFGQLNEMYDDNDDEYADVETETDDELIDELDAFQDEGIVAHDQEAVAVSEDMPDSFQVDTTAGRVMGRWINSLGGLSDVSFNVIAEAHSESGENMDEYNAIVSITPENSNETDELGGAMAALAEHFIIQRPPLQPFPIDSMTAAHLREVFGDEAAGDYVQRSNEQ